MECPCCVSTSQHSRVRASAVLFVSVSLSSAAGLQEMQDFQSFSRAEEMRAAHLRGTVRLNLPLQPLLLPGIMAGFMD